MQALNMDGDDTVELLVSCEDIFEIRISNDEALLVETVGDLFELVRSKIDSNEDNKKCASAMAFYRLRRALISLNVKNPLLPSSDLSFLEKLYTKPFVKKLEERSGLTLPRPVYDYVGRLGLSILIASFLVGFAMLVVKSSLPFVFIGTGVFGMLMMRIDRGRLPNAFRKTRSFVKETTLQNYGRLIRQGAHLSEPGLWAILTDVIAGLSGNPAHKIGRETYFYKSQIKRASA